MRGNMCGGLILYVFVIHFLEQQPSKNCLDRYTIDGAVCKNKGSFFEHIVVFWQIT